MLLRTLPRVVAAAAGWLAVVFAIWCVSDVVPGCWFYGRFGLPCPACGSTRALAALVGGRPGAAFALNPFFAALAPVSLLVVVIAAAKGPAKIVDGLARLPAAAWAAFATAVAALLLLNWVYLLHLSTR